MSKTLLITGGLAAAVAACSGDTGTLVITLTEPVGATLLETDIAELRVTLTAPAQTIEAKRVGSGFSLSFSVDANDDDEGQFYLQGFDGSGTLIAVGESPPIPIDAIDATIAIFVAPPLSIGASPGVLQDPRHDMTAAATTFGAVFVGGVSTSGFASTSIESYDVFSQAEADLTASPLLAPRVNPAVAVDAGGDIYVFAGSDGSGNPTSTLWQLDPTVTGSGAVTDITPGSAAMFARGAALALPLDTPDIFAISGTPAIELDTPSDLAAVTVTGVGSAVGPGGAVVGSDSEVTAMFIGDGNPGNGVVAFHGDCIELPNGGPTVLRHGHAVAGAPGSVGGVIVEIAGVLDGSDQPTTDAVVFDPAAGTATDLPNALTTARLNAAVAATASYLIVAGGQLDDVPCLVQTPCTLVGSGAVEVLDATTFAPVTTLNLVVPRTRASAIALPNNQILIVGGTDALGAPIATIELFTPDLPASL